MKVLVTGGAGYVGSYLVPHLLADGHEVTVYDTFWFGDGFLPKDNAGLTLVKGDIRDINRFWHALRAQDAVIHLACISNDTSCQLDEKLSTSINFDAFEPMVKAAKAAKVGRFIYCSSSSVYGLSEAPDVTEDHPLVPLTLYNKYKGLCEPILFSHQAKDFVCTIIRPATVCGPAPRMRFDLTVNNMTAMAVLDGCVTIRGGLQKRPNLHIKDMVDVYKLLLNVKPSLIAGETFNVGVENMRVVNIADRVAEVVGDLMKKKVGVTITPSTDNRSYHINSEKIYHVLGFRPKHTVADAIRDITNEMLWYGKWKDGLDNPRYTNIMQYQEKSAA